MAHAISEILKYGFFAALLVQITSCGYHDLQSPNQTSSLQSVSDRKITFAVGPFMRSVKIKDLEDYVNKNEINADIEAILHSANRTDNTVKTILTEQFHYSIVEMSSRLNSPETVALLTVIGKAVHPRLAKDYAVQAMRAAIIRSLEGDDTLTILEVLKNLPVDLMIDFIAALKLGDELGSVFPKK